MSVSTYLEEKFDQLLNHNAEKDAELEYLRKQLEQAMKNNQKEINNSHSVGEAEPSGGEIETHTHAFSEEEERRPRRSRRSSHHAMDFKVKIPEFKGQLDPDDFLEWLNTIERVFECKDVPDDKKVKFVALKLHKYASIWWSNVLSKRIRKGKGKVRT